jgi:NADPH:quinone reductase-like Zn-dependent oxidoreductase
VSIRSGSPHCQSEVRADEHGLAVGQTLARRLQRQVGSPSDGQLPRPWLKRSRCWLDTWFLARWRRRKILDAKEFVVRHNREDLAVLKELVEAGKVDPILDRRYTLAGVPEALRYQGEGHSRGKIVIGTGEAAVP